MHTQDIIQHAYTLNQPLLLIGETGTGKTTMVREFSESKKLPFTRININGDTSREDLLGKYVLQDGNTLWQDGAFLHAIKNGHCVLLDEINAALPEILFILQAILEIREGKLGNILLTEHEGQVVIPHKETRIFATMNPPSYAGTKDLNTATLSRFIVHHVDILGIDDMRALLHNKFDIESGHILQACEVLHSAHTAKMKGELVQPPSTRDIEQVLQLIKHGVDIPQAYSLAIVNKSLEEDTNMLKGIIQKCLKIDFVKLQEKSEIVSKSELLQKKIEKQVQDLEKLQKKISSII